MRQPDDLRALWRGQEPPRVTMTTKELDDRARRFARKIRFRNLREYVAVATVVPLFGAYALRPVGLVTRVACVLIVVAAFFGAAQLHRLGGTRPPPPPDAPTAEHLAHLRAELARQRDLLAAVPRWYVAPFLPGMVLFFAGHVIHAVGRGAPLGPTLVACIFPLAVCGALFAVVLLANARAARALGREIDSLGE